MEAWLLGEIQAVIDQEPAKKCYSSICLRDFSYESSVVVH